MGIAQGSNLCAAVVCVTKQQPVVFTGAPGGLLSRSRVLGGGLWRSRCSGYERFHAQSLRSPGCFEWDRGENGGVSEDGEEDYVCSTVMEAIEVKGNSEGFMIKLRDGRYLKCVHNNPNGDHALDFSPHPAIVLKIEDGTDILLPIIVSETPSLLLMATIQNVPIARPTLYQVVKEMIEKMNYQVKFVRVTKRVRGSYFSELCISKKDNQIEEAYFDLRPSDAINIAIQCNVPIQVNKHLAYNDGLRIIGPASFSSTYNCPDRLPFTNLDSGGQSCAETEEFNLVREMLIATVEERYQDAAYYRDKLTRFRSWKKRA